MAQPRALFIGTCRVIYPADHLRVEGRRSVRRIRHRVHAPRQVEGLVRILTGQAAINPMVAHLISDAAHNDLISTGSNATTESYLAHEQGRMSEYDAFVIEVSSLTESDIRTPSGLSWVNTFTARDLERDRDALDRLAASGVITGCSATDVQISRHDTRTAIAAMSRIKALLGGRPILWVSHANVVDRTPAHEAVWAARKRLADVLALGAKTLRDDFFDPTAIVEQLGQAAAFEKEGSDIYHYTPSAIEQLGAHYWDRLLVSPYNP